MDTSTRPPPVTTKQWCCLYDAIAGRKVGRTRDPARLWTVAADGAILHDAEVVDALCASGLLKPVSRARCVAAGRAGSALGLVVGAGG